MPSLTYQPEKYKSRLSRSVGAADTDIYIDALPVETSSILVIDKDSDANYEIILYAGVDGDGSVADPYKLTGCTRGLGSSGTSLVAGTGKSHGRVEIGSVDIHFFHSLMKAHVDGLRMMPQVANTAALPTTGNTQWDIRWVQSQVAFYYWTLSASSGSTSDWSPVALASTPNATTAIPGKVEEATQSENDAGTAAGASADLFATPAVNAATAQKRSWVYGTENSTRDNYTVTLTPALSAYSAGTGLSFKATTAVASEITIEDCEDAWNESVAAGVTATADADCRVGSFSSKLAVDASVAAGTILATEAITSTNISAHGSVGLWLKSSVTTASGDLQLLLDNTASCASPLESINLPALTANTWTYVVVALAAPASDTALISVGVKMVTDLGAFNLFIDDIKAVPSVNVNSVGLRAMRKNGTSRLVIGDIVAGQIVHIEDDGTYFQVLTPGNPLTTKGDLLVGIGSGDVSRLGVSTDGFNLTLDSTQSTGVKWAPGTKLLGVLNTPVTVTNTTTETTLFSATVPANSMSTGNIIRGELYFYNMDSAAGVTNDLTLRLYFGATLVASLALANGGFVDAFGRLSFSVSSNGATNSQKGTLFGTVSYPSAVPGGNADTLDIDSVGASGLNSSDLTSRGSAAIDTTSATTVSIKAQWGAADAGNTITADHGAITLFA